MAQIAAAPAAFMSLFCPRLLVGLLLSFGAAGAMEAPSARPGRLLARFGSIEVEHSPGQEHHAEALGRALPNWLSRLATLRASQAEQPPPPLSAADLRQHAEAMLSEISRWIGLEGATELQRQAYDVFVACYESQAATERAAAVLWWDLAQSPRVALWTHAELLQRFRRGEQIPDFRYDPATQQVRWEVAFETAPSDPDLSACEAAERLSLDNPSNYEATGEIVALALRPGGGRPRATESGAAEALRSAARSLDVVLPVMLDDPAGRLTPAQAVERHLSTREDFVRTASEHEIARNGAMIRLVLHETTEIGLVERYIGSSDRRWFCEGTANFVAAAVARDRAGEAIAREVFDLSGQLTRLARWQRQVDLQRWPAAEHHETIAAADPSASALYAARHAFATRAIALMTERHGDAVLPRLWEEVGRTPREQVTMATVEEAFRRVAGAGLSELVRAAEQRPIPSLLAQATPLLPRLR